MSGKRVKHIDITKEANRAMENEKVARELEPPRQELDISGEKDLYCSLDESRCSGICRNKNSVNGVVECPAVMTKHQLSGPARRKVGL